MTEPAGHQPETTRGPRIDSLATAAAALAEVYIAAEQPAAPQSDPAPGAAGLHSEPALPVASDADEDLVPLMAESALDKQSPPAEWIETAPPPAADPGDPSYYAHLFDEPDQPASVADFRTFNSRGHRIDIPETITQQAESASPKVTASPEDQSVVVVDSGSRAVAPQNETHGSEAGVTPVPEAIAGVPPHDTGIQPVMAARQVEDGHPQAATVLPAGPDAALVDVRSEASDSLSTSHGLETRVTPESETTGAMSGRDTGLQPVFEVRQIESADLQATPPSIEAPNAALDYWEATVPDALRTDHGLEGRVTVDAPAVREPHTDIRIPESPLVDDGPAGLTFDVAPGEDVASVIAPAAELASVPTLEAVTAEHVVTEADAESFDEPITDAAPDEEDEAELVGASSGGSVWTIPLLCAGIGLIACCLLIPLADANRRASYERQKLRADLESLQRQVAVNDEFVRRVHEDPTLAERLAQRQMKTVRKGSSVLPMMEQRAAKNDATEMSPFQLVAVTPPAPPPDYKPLGGTLATLCYQPRARLYLMGAGLMMMACGLVLGVGRGRDELCHREP